MPSESLEWERECGKSWPPRDMLLLAGLFVDVNDPTDHGLVWFTGGDDPALNLIILA